MRLLRRNIAENDAVLGCAGDTIDDEADAMAKAAVSARDCGQSSAQPNSAAAHLIAQLMMASLELRPRCKLSSSSGGGAAAACAATAV